MNLSNFRKHWPLVVAIVAAWVLFNASVAVPAALKVGDDPRNGGIHLYAYRSWTVHPRDLTVNLVGFGPETAPLDLFRALFQTADGLKGRNFGKVTLARGGRAVFTMDGGEFQALGQAYSDGENPVFLIRTLPEKLSRPDGSEAFGTWEGGLLGVFGKQMEDINAFAQAWVSGEPPAI